MNTRALLSLCAALPLLALPACAAPLRYTAKPIHAQVVDADTHQPLEGVIVTANWQLEQGTVGGNVPLGQLKVMETVTDKNGRFFFPAWGPKWVLHGFLVNRDPQLLLFKPGYDYLALVNHYTSDRALRLHPVRTSDWDGRRVEMRRFIDHPISIGPYKYETSAYAQRLSFLSTYLETIAMDDCDWKKIPRMLLALKTQKDMFRKQGIRFSFIAADDVPTNPSKCGAPEEFFRSYRP